MILYRSESALERNSRPVMRSVAIGVFDGLHVGHQTIIGETISRAADFGGSAAVFTFEPMPMEHFSPDDPPPRLTRFRERFELLESLGVDELFCPRFDAVRGLSSEAFIETLLVQRLSAKTIVVGDDFRFGRRRTAGVEELRAAGARFGFDVCVVPPVTRRGVRISSTAIRECLVSGDLMSAREMLGRDYSISGRVAAGRGLGREFGFPTANVNLKRRLAPVDGIFAVRVAGLGERLHDGVASVGTRPTIGGGEPVLEVYLFDFDRDIYGEYITVQFIARLREERKFDDIEALKAQMHIDAAAARAALAA